MFGFLTRSRLLDPHSRCTDMLASYAHMYSHHFSTPLGQRSTVSLRVLFILVIISAVFLILLSPVASHAESPIEAITRIRQGPHVPMPPPQMVYTSGAPGKGMTIENYTGHLLRVHFNGPICRTVEVPNRQSFAVALVVGSYEVATEVPGTTILPFYGTQTYQPHAHY